MDQWRAAPNEEGRFCVAMFTAEHILHELYYVCGGAFGDTDVSGCYTSYLYSSCFLSLMAQRYPCLGTAPCCAQIRLVEPWYFSGSFFANC